MALGGIAPVLIFNFQPTFLSSLISSVQGIPIVGNTLSQFVGIPIPIYLDEKFSGIVIESESKAIDIDTNVQARNDGKPASVDQRGLNSIVTVNMIGQKDSIMLGVLLALNDIVFQRVVAQTYNIHYLNGQTTIFAGLLHGFSTNVNNNEDLVRITLQISKANQQGPSPTNVISVLPKITGATPVAVPS